MQEATVQFQRLSHMYTILSNPDTRAHYDRWGDDDEEGGVRDEDPRNVFDVVAQFVRDLRRVTQDDLLVFAKEQAEAKLQDTVSKMEDEDLRAYYHRRKGDIRTMKEEVIGCETREDVQRFTQHLQNLVNAGELPQYDAFSDAVEKGKGKGRGKGRTKAKNPPATKTRAKRTKPRCEQGHHQFFYFCAWLKRYSTLQMPTATDAFSSYSVQSPSPRSTSQDWEDSVDEHVRPTRGSHATGSTPRQSSVNMGTNSPLWSAVQTPAASTTSTEF
eukprot:TRINITY_DN1062_c0_g1_i1.p1 TRINITY_DN1062_c0_g1~~TRINITY_DN1062_c0_g1_i1.p1  ORF type:complete len:272 (+),score=34.04 TRINITY_DN1062_c0_g1_i1:190-1005(+)